MLIFAGWVNRHQQDVIEYLQEENRALREQLGGKRLRFTDRQRVMSQNSIASLHVRFQELSPLRSTPNWVAAMLSPAVQPDNPRPARKYSSRFRDAISRDRSPAAIT
jgi:hypothetical protein